MILAIFESTSTLPNFMFGQFSVTRKLILNGGAISPIGLLFGILFGIYHSQ